MNYKLYATVEISQLQKKNGLAITLYCYMKLTHFISTSSTFVQELSMKKKCAISMTKLAFKHPRKHPRLLDYRDNIIIGVQKRPNHRRYFTRPSHNNQRKCQPDNRT